MKYSLPEYSPFTKPNNPTLRNPDYYPNSAQSLEKHGIPDYSTVSPFVSNSAGYIRKPLVSPNQINMPTNTPESDTDNSRMRTQPGMTTPPSSTMPTRPGMITPPASTMPTQPGITTPPASTMPTRPGMTTPPASTMPTRPGMTTPPASTMPTQPGMTTPPASTMPTRPGMTTPPSSAMPTQPRTTPSITMPPQPNTLIPPCPFTVTPPTVTVPPSTSTSPTMPTPSTTTPSGSPMSPTRTQEYMQLNRNNYMPSFESISSYSYMPEMGRNPYQAPMGVPMMPLYGYDNCEDADKDWDYMKQMYPMTAKKVMAEIDEECDKLEYDGSCMFDEYPDRVYLGRIVDRIFDKVKYLDESINDDSGRMESPMRFKQFDREDRYNRRDGFNDYNDQRDRYDQNRNDRGHNRDNRNPLRELIEVLLFNEILNRRRRYRGRRRWF